MSPAGGAANTAGLQRPWPGVESVLNGNAAVALLLVLGVGERVAWNLIRPGVGASGEAFNVAAALAGGRGFADAYQVGQGATAHLLPISPGIAGGIYAVFGVRSMGAEILLACWSIGLAVGAYLLLFRAFGRLGLPRVARLGALALLCLAPTYVPQEAVDFRIWEGGLSVLLTALFLDRLVAIETPSAKAIAGMALLNALLFFVNPICGGRRLSVRDAVLRAAAERRRVVRRRSDRGRGTCIIRHALGVAQSGRARRAGFAAQQFRAGAGPRQS